MFAYNSTCHFYFEIIKSHYCSLRKTRIPPAEKSIYVHGLTVFLVRLKTGVIFSSLLLSDFKCFISKIFLILGLSEELMPLRVTVFTPGSSHHVPKTPTMTVSPGVQNSSPFPPQCCVRPRCQIFAEQFIFSLLLLSFPRQTLIEHLPCVGWCLCPTLGLEQ